MTTTPETPAIVSKPPATRDGAGKPAPSAPSDDCRRGPERAYAAAREVLTRPSSRCPRAQSTTRSGSSRTHRSERQSSPADIASPRRGPPSLPGRPERTGRHHPGLTRTRRRHRPRLVSVRSDVTRVGVRVARVDHDDQGGQWRLRLDRGRLAYRLPSVTSRKLRGSPRQWRARR